MTSKMEKMQNALSQALGRSVKITIRHGLKFTFSTETVDKELPSKVADYFGSLVKIEGVEHDDECGSFVYVTAAA